MPKRVIDFDAMWGSDKLASCAAWAQPEYAWLYGLADASGCFEVTNLRVIWGKVAAIRGNFTIERLEQVISEFQDKGLLFVWEHEGKRYAHWTGSDVPGRLPPHSWRVRLEKFAPPVPKQRLAEYMGQFARGRAALGAGFRGQVAREEEDFKSQISDFKEKPEIGIENSDSRERRETGAGAADLPSMELQPSGQGDDRAGNECQRHGPAGLSGIKDGVEEPQAQDWNLNLDWNVKEKWELGPDGERRRSQVEIRERDFEEGGHENSKSEINTTVKTNANSNFNEQINARANATANSQSTAKALNREDLNSIANSNEPASSSAQHNSCARTSLNARRNAIVRGNAMDCSRLGVGSQRIADQENDLGLRAGLNSGSQVQVERDVASGAGRDNYQNGMRYFKSERELALARELRVGQGPVCGPYGVRREAIERSRQREAAWAKERKRAP